MIGIQNAIICAFHIIYSVYRRWNSKVLTLIVTDRKYTAPVDTFQLYWADPTDLKCVQENSSVINKHIYYVSEMKWGSWDKDVVPIHERVFLSPSICSLLRMLNGKVRHG